MPGTYYGGHKYGCMFSEEGIHLRDCFRLLWEQHVYWTRMTIISIAASSPDLEATTNRLLRNPPDFAIVFNHFYGGKIASKFENLLKDHLTIFAEFVNATKDSNNNATTNAETSWYENADEIIHFLNCINPYWSRECMKKMWYQHLELTKNEAVARLEQDYKKDIEIFDQIEKEALLMADQFSNGIIRQFCL